MASGDNYDTQTPDFVVGIDLGGTKIRAGIASRSGSIIADRIVPTMNHGSSLVDQITGLVHGLANDIGVDPASIVATGIGGAGVPSKGGTGFDLAPNLPGVSEVPFTERIADVLSHRVVLDNDVNAAALGELHYGVGLHHRDFVIVSIGTGIGMGIVVDGKLVRGATGAAGEIGFLPIGTDPLDLENQRRGPLEEAVAGDALVRRYAAASGNSLTSEEVFSRALTGDPAAIDVVDTEARWLATALVAVSSILDPEVVVLGGGIGSRSDLLPRVAHWLERLGAPRLDIRLSELGHRGPVAGAIRLALDTASTSPKGT